MKKWIAAAVTLAVLAGLVPAALATQTTPTIRVGWGKVDVTPRLTVSADDSSVYYLLNRDGTELTDAEGNAANVSIHLAGSFNTSTRLATSVEEGNGLYMKAIALSDGDTVRVVMTTDFIRVPIAWNEYVETAVLEAAYDDSGVTYQEQYGLTEGFLSISATHTHSSVDIGDQKASSSVTQSDKWHVSTERKAEDPTITKDSLFYEYYWLPCAVEAVQNALNDLQEVSTIKAGSSDLSESCVPGYEESRMNWVRHWIYSDGAMRGTNTEGSGGSNIDHGRDPDRELQLIRFVRDDADDVVLINWQAHPTNAMSKINKKLSADYPGLVCNYLEENNEDVVAAFFQGAAGNVAMRSPIKSGDDDVTYITYGSALGALAQSLLSSDGMVDVGSSGTVQGMRSEHVAVERGYKTWRTIQQDVITAGGSIAFATAGYEMFDSNGEYVKDNSPYAYTFIIENAQGHEYMPDWQACHYELLGGPTAYENWDSCHNMVPGTAEDLADDLVTMLNTLYDNA